MAANDPGPATAQQLDLEVHAPDMLERPAPPVEPPVPVAKRQLEGWGRYRTAAVRLARPERLSELRQLILEAERPLAVLGSGTAQGDASLNSHGTTIAMGRLDRFLEFDRERGLVTLEAGLSVREVLKVTVPAGWTLPAVPAFSAVSIGGCIASDAHGRNHRRRQGFGAHVLSLTLMTAAGELIETSPTERPDLFQATIGGLGLTGVVVEARIKLMPVATGYMVERRAPVEGLENALDVLDRASELYEYASCWLDLATPDGPLTGACIASNPAHADDLPAKLRDLSPAIAFAGNLPLPFPLPRALVRRETVSLLNKARAKFSARGRGGSRIRTLGEALFPWDGRRDWHKLYGARGFLDYQICLPKETALLGLTEITDRVRLDRSTDGVFMASLMRMADTPAPLGFPRDGFSLRLELRATDEAFELLDHLDERVVALGGRVYLAKDGRLSRPAFERMYPGRESWLAIKRRWDANTVFASDLGRRLALSPA